MKATTLATITALALGVSGLCLHAQDNNPPPRPGSSSNSGNGQGRPPGGFEEGGGPGGQGGPGGPGGQGGGRDGFRPPEHPLMTALDTNHDGIIDADEIAHAVESLKKLDKNHDGKLTPDELRPAGAPGGRGREMGQGQQGRPGGAGGPPGEAGGQGGPGGATQRGGGNVDFVTKLMQYDKNGDGKVTKDELPEQLQWVLDRADTNKDGAIDRQEAEAFAKKTSQSGGQTGTRRPSPPGGAQPSTTPSRPPIDQ